MFAWMEGLNEQQEQAVSYDGPALLVVAGAGTGKTGTLAARVARFLAEGVVPERILLLTFSRRAAKELLNRAGQMSGVDGAHRVWGGTFHAVANKVLRLHGTSVGLDPAFTILDASDTVELIGLVRDDLGVATGRRRFPRKETLATIYSRTVNAGVPLKEVLKRWFPWCEAEADGIKAVCEGYVERKRQRYVLDYDDLLLYWRALATDPVGGAMVAERFDHVLVDEYQDTNRVQAEILAGLHRPGGPTITAVGDDAQAIYGFRAADVANMLEFPTRFAATVVTLDRNYRSTPQILATANAVMREGVGFGTSLRTERRSSERPTLTACEDETMQANLVCERVLEHRERGVDLREQVVLFRSAHHSAGLELELARRDIPFVKYGGLRFLEAGHVKDLLAALRIVDNPRDELGWRRVLALLDGVGPATARRVVEELGDRPLTAFLGARSLADLGLPEAAAEQAVDLQAALADCGREPEPPPGVQIERLTTWLAPLLVERYPNAAARITDLEELAHLAGPRADRRSFLAELTIDPPTSTSDLAGPPHLDDDFLILSTIHSAKGGEWRVVHVIHASDGNIPSDMALSDKEGLEEERRLLYVALTRTKDTLHITYPQRYYFRRDRKDDLHAYGQPSRFLAPAIDTVDRLVHRAESGADGDAVRASDAVGAGAAAGSAADTVAGHLAGLWR